MDTGSRLARSAAFAVDVARRASVQVRRSPGLAVVSLLIGIALFGAASLGCAISVDWAQLVCGRFVQGVGAGGCQLYSTDLKKIFNYRDFFSTDSAKYMRFHKELLKRGFFFYFLRSRVSTYSSAPNTLKRTCKHVSTLQRKS